MTAALATLNPAALVTLADCEQRIERGLKTFIDVGQALAEIRDSRLYKGTHETFEAYLEQRWQMSRSYAHRMIAAAEVVLPIGNTDLPTPTNEGQARALGKVPEAERADVWREAVERTDGKPTAAAVREVHEERTRPTETPGPVDTTTSPADPGVTPAPAVESPVLTEPREPDPVPTEALIAAVLEALDGHGQLGRSVAEIWTKAPPLTPSSMVQLAVEELVRRGRVTAGPVIRGTARWLLTPEPAAAPSTAPAGPGTGEAVAPAREGGGATATPDLSALVLAVLPIGEDDAVSLAELAGKLPDGCWSYAEIRQVLDALEDAGRAACTQGPDVLVWWATGLGEQYKTDPAARIADVAVTAPEFVRPVEADPLVAAVTLAGLSDGERAAAVGAALSAEATPEPAAPVPSAVPTLRLDPTENEKRAAVQRDARRLLLRVVEILDPAHDRPGFAETWARQLGPYDAELSDLIRRATEAIATLDDLVERCGQ